MSMDIKETNDETLEFIFGSARSNSIDIIMKKIEEDLDQGNEKIILLVPDQTTFEVENKALEKLEASKMNKINVLSFNTLCDSVFSKTGNTQGDRVNDGLRAIILGMILNKPEIKEYKQGKESEMINLLMTTIKEFKTQGVSATMLNEVSEKVSSGRLKNKLKYVSSVMEIYDTLISNNKYIDPLDDLTKLALILNNNKIFEGYNIYIDSFISFTIQQYEVIKALFSQCKKIVVSLCVDTRLIENDYFSDKDRNLGIFDISFKTINRLYKIASKYNKKIIEPTILESNNKGELDFLEQNIFRSTRERYKNKLNNIKIHQASSIYEECDFIAGNIKRLIMTGNYRYRDFSIIMRDTKEYDGIIDLAFKRYDLPYFMEGNVDIESKPLIKFIYSIIDILRTNFSSEHVLKYIKTGLIAIEQDDIYLLENYVFTLDINKEEWFEDFKSFPEVLNRTNINKEEFLKRINEVRKSVIEPLKRLSNKINGAMGKEICIAIYDLIEEMKIPQKIVERSKKFKDSGELYLSKEEIQVWKIIIKIFDHMVIIFENTKISLKEFQRILKIAISAEDILSIPQCIDEIKVYSADKMIFHPTKVFFVLGAVMGKFPRVPEYKGLFNFSERKKLIQLDIEIYDFVDDLSSQERFLAYKAISSGTESLFVTFYKLNFSGDTCRPSEIINQIKYIFPNIEYIYNDNFSKDYILSEEQAFEYCSKNWNSGTLIIESLKKYFKNHKEYSSKYKSLEKASNEIEKRLENKEILSEILGKDIRLSASKIETFYSCKFKYFCKYILQAKERKKVLFDSMEYGNLMHFLLERIFLLKNDENDENINYLLNKYMEEVLGGNIGKTDRFKYLFFRIKETIKVLVDYICSNLDEKQFQPKNYEFNVSKRIYVDDKTQVLVEGKIDRVDTMEEKTNKKNYVRIIDYKTGSKKFELTDVLYGINMQMLIYLLSICDGEQNKYKGFTGAGVLYMPAKLRLNNIDLIKRKEESGQEFRQESESLNLKMDGLIIDNTAIKEAMKNEVASGCEVVSLEKFKIIEDYVEDKIKLVVKKLKEGEIAPEPIGGICETCPYMCICGYESNDAKTIKKLDKEKILDEMSKEKQN